MIPIQMSPRNPTAFESYQPKTRQGSKKSVAPQLTQKPWRRHCPPCGQETRLLEIGQPAQSLHASCQRGPFRHAGEGYDASYPNALANSAREPIAPSSTMWPGCRNPAFKPHLPRRFEKMSQHPFLCHQHQPNAAPPRASLLPSIPPPLRANVRDPEARNHESDIVPMDLAHVRKASAHDVDPIDARIASMLSELRNSRAQWCPQQWMEARDQILRCGQLQLISSLWQIVLHNTEEVLSRHSCERNSEAIKLASSTKHLSGVQWIGRLNVRNVAQLFQTRKKRNKVAPPLLVCDATSLDVVMELSNISKNDSPIVLVAELSSFSDCGNAQLSSPSAVNPRNLLLCSNFSWFVRAAESQLRRGQASTRDHLCAGSDPYVFFCPNVTIFRGSREEGYPLLKEPVQVHVIATAMSNLRPSVRMSQGANRCTEWYSEEADHNALLDRLNILGSAALQACECEGNEEAPTIVLTMPGCSEGVSPPRDAIANLLKHWRQRFSPHFRSMFVCCGGCGDEEVARSLDHIINRQVYRLCETQTGADRMMPWHWDSREIAFCIQPEMLYCVKSNCADSSFQGPECQVDDEFEEEGSYLQPIWQAPRRSAAQREVHVAFDRSSSSSEEDLKETRLERLSIMSGQASTSSLLSQKRRSRLNSQGLADRRMSKMQRRPTATNLIDIRRASTKPRQIASDQPLIPTSCSEEQPSGPTSVVFEVDGSSLEICKRHQDELPCNPETCGSQPPSEQHATEGVYTPREKKLACWSNSPGEAHIAHCIVAGRQLASLSPTSIGSTECPTAQLSPLSSLASPKKPDIPKIAAEAVHRNRRSSQCGSTVPCNIKRRRSTGDLAIDSSGLGTNCSPLRLGESGCASERESRQAGRRLSARASYAAAMQPVLGRRRSCELSARTTAQTFQRRTSLEKSLLEFRQFDAQQEELDQFQLTARPACANSVLGQDAVIADANQRGKPELSKADQELECRRVFRERLRNKHGSQRDAPDRAQIGKQSDGRRLSADSHRSRRNSQHDLSEAQAWQRRVEDWKQNDVRRRSTDSYGSSSFLSADSSDEELDAFGEFIADDAPRHGMVIQNSLATAPLRAHRPGTPKSATGGQVRAKHGKLSPRSSAHKRYVLKNNCFNAPVIGSTLARGHTRLLDGTKNKVDGDMETEADCHSTYEDREGNDYVAPLRPFRRQLTSEEKIASGRRTSGFDALGTRNFFF